MTSKYDVELLLSDVSAMFIAKLNTKITAVNLEKQNDTPEMGDNFDIDLINANAWYLNHIPSIWSYPVFVVYGLAAIEANENQNDVFGKKVDLFFEVVIPDAGEKKNESQIYKLLRYSRCLEEVVMENYDTIRGYGKLTVASLVPTAIEVNGKILKASGVTVSASITS